MANKKDYIPNKKESNKKNIDFLSNDWFYLIIIFLFWLFFFRSLLSGNAYLFDDFIEQYYPGKLMSSVSIANGEFPFWNPYIFSGVPFFADMQIAVLYPFNLILAFFVQNNTLSALSIQNSIIIHYLFCGIFSFYLGKRLKINNLFSTVFSILFTYSSYMIVHMMHMPLIEAVVWFPLILLLWLKFIDEGEYLYPILAGIIMAISILAGYPQVPFFNYFFISVLVLIYLIDSIISKDFKRTVKLAVGLSLFLIIPFGLTAFQLLPATEYVSLSNRAEFNYDFAKQGSFHIYDLITLFIPKYFGVWSGNEMIKDLPYWSTHQEGPWMFSIANLFTSTIFIVLIFPVINYIVREKYKSRLLYFLFGMIIFTFLFSLGGNFFFHKLLYDYIPFFNRFRNPAHILYLFTLSALLIEFIIISKIIEDGKISEYFGKNFILFFIILTVFFLFIIYSGIISPSESLKNPKIAEWIKSQLNIFIVFFILFSIIFLSFSKRKISFQFFSILILLLIFIEIIYIWFDQNNGTKNPEQIYKQNSQLIKSLRDEGMNEKFRVNMREGRNMLFQRNQGYIDRVEFIEGYGALMLKNFIPPGKKDTVTSQTHDLMNVKYKINTDASKKSSSQLLLNSSYLPRAKMYYNVIILKDSSEVRKIMEGKEFNHFEELALEDSKIHPLKIINEKETVNNKVSITSYSLNEITLDVDTEKDGYLFLSEVYYPAWRAYIDDSETEILKADFCLRAIFLKSGSHKIKFKYESSLFKTGLMISLISCFVVFPLLGISSYSLIRNKKRKIK